MSTELIARQAVILEEIKRIQANFKKDSAIRKTSKYLTDRLEKLENLWLECVENDAQLQKEHDKSHQYFTENIFDVVSTWYAGTRKALQASNMPASVDTEAGTSDIKTINVEEQVTAAAKDEKEKTAAEVIFDTKKFLGEDTKLMEHKQLQNANFRALKRYVESIKIDTVNEKWEIEDKLKLLQTRWTAVENVHLQIDSITNGTDIDYYDNYMLHELKYERVKKSLNSKLSSSIHQQLTLPKLEIPQFFGNYTQWPTFKELYNVAIHNNPALSKAQKMQHLKGKLKGEAEKLVQHLQITAENYDVCWELLTHRYNNKQVLFTKQFQTFMRQPNLQKQSSADLKRLYDTSMETIHAIYNLGVDTASCDPVLVHILCEKLDTDTYSDYMKMRAHPRELPSLDEFMGFIEAKFTALEPLTKRKSDTSPAKPAQPAYRQSHTFNKYTKSTNQSSKGPMNSNYHSNYHVSTNKIKCSLCNDDHALFQCKRFLSMTPNEQLKHVTKSNICKNCLYVHTKNYCKSEKRCKECNEPHNTMIHKAFANQPSSSSSPAVPSQRQAQNSFVVGSDEDSLLPTALIQVADENGNYHTLRALIDQGSEITLITENAVQTLGLQRQALAGNITGVGTLSNKSRGKVHLKCKSLHNDFEFFTDALILTRVVRDLPSTTFAKKNWGHIDNITLADPQYNISHQIDLLLNVQVYSKVVMNGLLKGETGPIAQQTQLGWILSGVVKSYNCHVVINDTEDLAKYWEVEDITDNKNQLTSQEEYCENFYATTTRRLENGKYEVRLPMKENFAQHLGESKPQAIAQFRQLERKLMKDENLSAGYKKFIDEYLEMGHMKECSAVFNPQCHLSHHAVHKSDSLTTKLRVVFNGSQRTSSGQSLNDLMECGPKLHQDLQTLLLQWRRYKFVMTTDCEKMYRMILVHEKDQHLQKIIWRDNPNQPLKEYQLTTVTYGQKAAPFLALRTLKQLAIDDAEKYPLAANVINNEIYVDDVLTGSDNLDQALEIQNQLICILKGAGFNLRKWMSNTKALLENIPDDSISPTVIDFNNAHATKTLGLQWHPARDTFSFKNTFNDKPKGKLTKRSILSEISKIYDPLGFLTPLTIKAKILFQSIWQSNCNWDDTVSEQVQNDWYKFTTDIRDIETIEIPRWLGDMTHDFEIHGFCDSSEKAYACCIYVRTADVQNKPVVTLIAAKSRLAPISQSQKQTLPRLELCATVLLSQLMKKVIQALKWECLPDNTFAWSDSMITLSWLKGDPTKWKTFVSNRVKQVLDVIPSAHWNHVKSEDNAADCATRGLSVSNLKAHSLWWQGPEWLKNFDKTSLDNKIPATDCEVKPKQANVVQSEPPSLIMELLSRHSNMTHITRVLAWILRFIAITRMRTMKAKLFYLTVAELLTAEKVIVKHIQHYDFPDEIRKLRATKTVSTKSNILKLNPFLDDNDVLRVGGRLNNSSLHDYTKHPMIIAKNSRLTELLVKRAHLENLHGGPKLTLVHLRDKYWIVGGYQAVKKYLHQCVTCRRFNAAQQQQIMADLPRPRVTPSRPFLHTGIDFTGFVDIKANKGRGIKTLKAYIAVFVCLATKAVHLELVSELSSSAFLAAFRRFCARRGAPKDMYSDNGTNFVAANRQLQKEHKEILQSMDTTVINCLTDKGTTWHFNAPAWPSAGGLWEASVKSTKYHLKRVIGEQKLTYEEFSTLLH
ncbi:uncharacterized protein LOC134806751 [Cydia splendana]|uniref:uncharacterized protein LOC134806751 n=1 Tax=Cydia splendana TaxID=1100963 RepID=UPI00300C9A6B